MRTLFLPAAFLLSLFALTLGSCEKKDPIIPNEEEVITTLVYTLTPNNGGLPVIFSFSDPDGDGGDAPVLTNGTLQANMLYTGELTLFNETAKPTESVHTEVLAEGLEHQVFFENTLTNATIRYTDQDTDGNALGLMTELETRGAEQGTLTIILKHNPDKTATGVAIDNAAPAGGETDIEVQFNVGIQ